MSLLAAYLATLTSAPRVQLEPFYYVSDFSSRLGDTVTAGFRLNSNGKILRADSTEIDNWIIPNSAAPGSYQAQLSGLIGDALAVGSAQQNNWVNLSESPIWFISQSQQPGIRASTFTIEIRAGSTVLTTSSVSLEVGIYSSDGDGDLQPPNIN
jgi:hypothetical protein